MDTRKALGDGIPDPALPKHEPMPVTEPLDERKNRLPGPYPYERRDDAKPEIPYTGTANPAMASNRPIADMTPDHGDGDIDEGVAFRVPIGEPGYDDPDFR